MEYWVMVPGLDNELFVISRNVETTFAVGDEVGATLAHTGVALVPQH
jgi:hypothetical protein